MVREAATKLGATPSQVALSWVTNKPVVSSTIIGARTMKQLTDNLAAANLQLVRKSLKRWTPSAPPHPRTILVVGVLQRHCYLDSSDQALRELPTT